MRFKILATVAALGVGALLSGCGGASPTGSSTLIDASEITPILGTTALRVGTQRVAFLLEGRTALVTTPEVEVRASKADGSTGKTVTATFHQWPFGTRGTYVTELTFEEPGEWLLRSGVPRSQARQCFQWRLRLKAV